MELKPYQQEVIKDLADFIEELKQTEQLNIAFAHFWERKGVSLRSAENQYLKPYDNSIKKVPRVTVKVPTAGGKTFIACNALKTIFDSFPAGKPKVVVWFVPSDTILKQSYNNLNNPEHPYRSKIDSHFNSAVRVYDKESLLFGQGISPAEVKEQLSIFVLSVQSFVETVRKGLPRAYRENENLAEFPTIYQQPEKLLPNIDETALIQVIAQLNPVVVIDESHNFEADLRIDMLNNINPSFIFDLTATPRDKSNIISFVDSMKLKKNNMVKLPVIVYNHQSTNEVIISAIQMRKALEEKALLEEKTGGKYIRPIVLFQAQPKTDSDNITFEKIKDQLIDVGIPENQIKIKTAGKDEIKNTDLISRDCEVRFIITVNALKEGWDCPFAYILASLANKTSAVDVEQVLGRILRLPYVRKHQQELLNYSYVFTSSNHFLNTLDNIIKGLNKAGFSSKDYRAKEIQEKQEIEYPEAEIIPEDLFQYNKEILNEENEPEIDVDNIKELSDSEQSKEHINNVVIMAHEASEEMERKMEELDQEDFSLPSEVKEKMEMYPIKEIFKDEVKEIKLPSLYKIIMSHSIIQPQETLVLLTKNMLLDGFDLSKEDHKIDFTKTASEMYNIDLAEGRKDEFLPEYRKVNDKIKERFFDYISALPLPHQITQLSGLLLNHIRNMDEISDSQLEEYIARALSGLNSEKISEISNNLYQFARIIREKIISLTERYVEKQFINFLDKGIIICKDSFEFPKSINPKKKIHGITKNLYVEEGDMNDFEKRVINEVANLDSVVFWHRNFERSKGFLINGFINHYPDFIVKMKNGKIIIIETKGDHLDGSDSVRKIKLGEKWASKAGDNYRYFMVFENTKLDGAKSLSELKDILKEMK